VSTEQHRKRKRNNNDGLKHKKETAMRGKQASPEARTLKDFIAFIIAELKPRGKIFTPFNIISAPILALGIILIIYRLINGLGSVVAEAPGFPWGIWIGFNVMVGVAFAGGAYVLTFVVYILRSEKYHPIIRATILNGFLAYVFYAGAILLDLGRWWNIVNPLIGNKFGVNSVLFLVAWHFLLYMIAEFLEFSPAFAEWLGLKRIRKILRSFTLGAVIFGITLSTLHQSGLGALVMMARPNIHPLWYTEFIPVLFFVSGIFGGLSMVIFEGTISSRVFGYQLTNDFRRSYDDIVLGLAKTCAAVMFVYLFLKALVLIHGAHLSLITSPMGYWYLIEVVGLTLIPCILYLRGFRDRNIKVIRIAAVLTMAGIIINRCNYVFIAYKWYVPLSERYIPSWQEVVMALTIVFAHIWVFRWIAHRMAVYRKPPAWAVEQDRREGKKTLEVAL
jgi:Ni/Fe-hydrogenase subunit HybB-like protein